MSLQAVLTTQLLPPLAIAWIAVLAGAIAMRRHRAGGGLVMLGGIALLALATPLVGGSLRAGLEREAAAPPGPAPAAIVILAAGTVRTAGGFDIGPLSLERLRAGAALHRATGLPVLVSGGALGRDQPPVARLMADSLAADFGVTARWVEDTARDTRENATRSAAMLRAAGIAAAHLVTHGWHMPRAAAAFARAGFPVRPAPARRHAPPGRWSDLVPQPRMLGETWLMLREWAGRLVYRLRDGAA